ncbi:DUF6090 family protein [Ekhidna sp. To15]|uniref:DUF6090 family protein n=1 Tax=Ekhidna sp. To15 TaxID=3395267 RepID=UPI003F528812
MKNNWKEYLIELVIVIIGITVAFWLNNMAEESKENKLEDKFIADVRADLIRDSSNLAQSIKYNDSKVDKLEKIIMLVSSDQNRQYQDSLMNSIGVIGNYVFFYPESFTLNSLLQSGDFKLLTSDQLKKELLRYRWICDMVQRDQTNFLNALDDNYYPKLLAARDMLSNQIVDEEFFYGIEFKNWTAYTYNDTKNMSYSYQRTLKQLVKILDLIEQEELVTHNN